MSNLRYRERSFTQLSPRTMGHTFYRNARNGHEIPGSPQIIWCSPDWFEKCFDVNNGIRDTYQVGGNFFLVRVTNPGGIAGYGRLPDYQALSQAPPEYKEKPQQGDLWRAGYEGSFVHTGLPDLTSIPGKDISGPDDYRAQVNPNDLSSLGARGWTKLRPSVDVAGLGQAIAEARDIPRTLKTSWKPAHEIWKGLGGSQHVPIWSNRKGDVARLLKDVKRHPKRLSDQFLNAIFGWKPLVNDLGNLFNLVSRYEAHLDKAMRSNDKWLNRRFAEEDIVSETVVMNDTKHKASPIFRTYLAPALGSNTCTSVNLTVKRQRMTRIWYEGSFRYYNYAFDKHHPAPQALKDAQGFLSLAGADINPSLIWKVTPWTFLADWFVNIGDNIQVAQDIIGNSVACRYMYLMRESYDRYEYTTVHTYPTTTITCTSYQEVRVKRRASAESPFGFSLLPGGLSGMQLAIMAALGISKFP